MGDTPYAIDARAGSLSSMQATSKTSHTHARRSRKVALTVALGLAGLAWASGAQASFVPARAARTLNVSDEAHLHLSGTQGEVLLEEGPATGALAGTVKVRFTVGATVSGSFTIYPRGGGSITGQGSARLHSTGAYASFGGSMSISHGTGRYAYAHGHGGFYGTVNRRTDALVVQTTGRLTY
jgi:hypothetical protein